MKETIAEYSRVIIVVICFAALCLFILQPINNRGWLNMLGKTFTVVENEIKEEQQLIALEETELRKAPVLLIVAGETHEVGSTIGLRGVVAEAYTKTSDGRVVDLMQYVEIRCAHPSFNEKEETLSLNEKGIYHVTYSVQDEYGIKTTKRVSFVAI